MKCNAEAVVGAEFHASGNLSLQFVLKKTFSDDPEEDAGDAPTVFDKRIVINCGSTPEQQKLLVGSSA